MKATSSPQSTYSQFLLSMNCNCTWVWKASLYCLYLPLVKTSFGPTYFTYLGSDKSLARPTSRCIFFFVLILRLMLVLLYIQIALTFLQLRLYIRYMKIKIFCRCSLFPSIGLTTYQHPYTWGQFRQVPTKAIVTHTSSRCQHQFAPARHSMLPFITVRFLHTQPLEMLHLER
jgi:hypothetical protein